MHGTFACARRLLTDPSKPVAAGAPAPAPRRGPGRPSAFARAVACAAGLGACAGESAPANDADVTPSDDASAATDARAPRGDTSMRFSPASDAFFDLPFPDDARRGAAAGSGDVFSSWPGAEGNFLLERWFATADDLLDGWGLSSAVFAYFSAPLDASSLPADAEASLDFADGPPPVFLVDVDPESPARGEVLPIACQFREEAGSYHAPYQVGCISPFGVVRRPDTRYALVFTTAVRDADGLSIVPSAAMTRLLAGEDVAGRFETVDAAPYRNALDVVAELGVDEKVVASVVLFTTHDPSARLRRVNAWYRDLPTPTIDDALGLDLVDVYEDYVVLEGHYDLPVIQEGERPYTLPPSGRIALGPDGEPELVDTQRIRFYLTLPRSAPPAAGYPILLYLHGSGGVAEQLMDRGAESEDGSPPEAGTGPAAVVAPYGLAGFAADFNLHGMRHDPPDTTGLKLYNIVTNPRAAIDNFIIAANEITLHARLLEALEIEVAEVDGLGEALPGETEQIGFDREAFALFGQSMGSTIGLPALTVDPTIAAGIFSGSGGVMIEIALESTQPLPLDGLLRLVLGYSAEEPFDRFDPLLSALQHVWDLVDPVAHGRFVISEPHDGLGARHLLQTSGLEDGYFSPASRAAFSAAVGAQLVEPVLEPEALELMRWVGLDAILSLPAGENLGGTTAVVAQYEPSVLDGHHVAFQRDDAKAQYACFLRSFAAEGAPSLRDFESSKPEACAGD